MIEKEDKLNLHITVYFGVPGSGKTTIAAALAHKHNKRNGIVFSNMPIKGCYKYTKQDLGTNQFERCTIILDEASCEFNSRKFKEMTMECIKFFKLHRHYKCEIAVFSQSYEDFDITIKRLSYRYFYVQKSLIPFVINAIPIKVRFGINDTTNKPDDIYSIQHPIIRLFTTRRYFGPKYWKHFDSWEYPPLPPMKRELW